MRSGAPSWILLIASAIGSYVMAAQPCPTDCPCHQVSELALPPVVKSPHAGYTGVIYVYSDACTQCKKESPLVDKLILEGKPIIKVRVIYAEDLKKYASTGVPVTLACRRGVEVGRVVGPANADQLRVLLTQIKEK